MIATNNSVVGEPGGGGIIFFTRLRSNRAENNTIRGPTNIGLSICDGVVRNNTISDAITGLDIRFGLVDGYYNNITSSNPIEPKNHADVKVEGNGIFHSYENEFNTTNITRDGSQILYFRKIDVEVTWLGNGSPVDGAFVNITYPALPQPPNNSTTGVDGMSRDFFLLEHRDNATNRTNWTDYNLNVTKELDGRELKDWTTFNISTAAPRLDVRLDDVPPTLKVLEPQDGYATNLDIVTVKGRTDPNNDKERPVVVLLKSGINTYRPPVDKNGYFEQDVELYGDRNYPIDIGSFDFNLNEAKTTITVVRDTAAPSLQVISPSDGLLTNITGLIVGGKAERGAKLTVNGKVVNLTTNGTFDVKVILHEGINVLTVTAIDKAGNNKTVIRTVTLDTVPPRLTITEPRTDAPRRDRLLKVAGTTEAGAEVTIDNEPVPLDQTTFTKFIALTEGNNSIVVKSCDRAGNCNSRVVRAFLDSTPPKLEVLRPIDNLVTNQTSVEVVGITEPDANVTVNGIHVATYQGNFTKVIGMKEGLNAIKVESMDILGNKATVVREVTVDTVPPDLTILFPDNGTLVAKSSVLVEGYMSGGEAVTVSGKDVPLSDHYFSTEVPLVEGKNRIVVKAYDRVGNMAQAILVVIRDTTVNLTVHELVEGRPIEVRGWEYRITGKTDLDARVLVNGTPVKTDASGHFEAVVPLGLGTNLILIKATDQLGNTAVKEMVIIRTNSTGTNGGGGNEKVPGTGNRGVWLGFNLLMFVALVLTVLGLGAGTAIAVRRMRKKGGAGGSSGARQPPAGN